MYMQLLPILCLYHVELSTLQVITAIISPNHVLLHSFAEIIMAYLPFLLLKTQSQFTITIYLLGKKILQRSWFFVYKINMLKRYKFINNGNTHLLVITLLLVKKSLHELNYRVIQGIYMNYALLHWGWR